ncbi:uncharacterized protein LOC131051292 [Cryptomeria japonica]|uniref:uncharacterized protein LOC131051292 n=1 Tax=Cryptomeria japonica TaxID=3369 RepID=UPI0027D9CF62|nr:uncharacterized protein LOC131051292 [Cryptomeria japonica]
MVPEYAQYVLAHPFPRLSHSDEPMSMFDDGEERPPQRAPRQRRGRAEGICGGGDGDDGGDGGGHDGDGGGGGGGDGGGGGASNSATTIGAKELPGDWDTQVVRRRRSGGQAG